MFSNIPMHMNIMVIYFTLLPFVLFYSISLAKKRKYKAHFISQFFILSLTLVVLLYFEIMIRIDGGFFEFAKQSSFDHDFLVKYLIFHITIALIAAILWLRLFIKSYLLYKNNQLELLKSSSHKKMGIITSIFLFLSCLTGVFVYLFLFIF